MLNRRGVELIGQRMKHELALVAVVSEYADFDQAVRVQRQFGFFGDSGTQTVVTDHDHRVEVVRRSAVNFAFSRGQLDSRHTGIIFLHRGC